MVDKHRVKMSTHVNYLGLSTYDIVEASTEGASLGVHYDEVIGLVAGSPEKDIVLDQAFIAILKRAKLIGLDMNKVLGHATVRCMLGRPLFSIFRHSYTFGDMVGNVGVSVWASVRYEIWLLRALLILAQFDVRSGFSSYAFMTDACSSGYGV